MILTEDDFCPICGDIIEPDDVTGELICLCGHGDDDNREDDEPELAPDNESGSDCP